MGPRGSALDGAVEVGSTDEGARLVVSRVVAAVVVANAVLLEGETAELLEDETAALLVPAPDDVVAPVIKVDEAVLCTRYVYIAEEAPSSSTPVDSEYPTGGDTVG